MASFMKANQVKQRRPTAYDRGQHQLICAALGVSEDPGAPGQTAFEAVCELIKELPPKRQKELGVRANQLMRAEILGRLSKLLREKAIDSWLHSPNKGFDNQKPIDMLDSGQFEPLLRMLDWLGAKSLP